MRLTRGRVEARADVVVDHKDRAALRGNVSSRAWFQPVRVHAVYRQEADGYVLEYVRVHGPNSQSWGRGGRPGPEVEARWSERPQSHPEYQLARAPLWVQNFVKAHKPGGTK